MRIYVSQPASHHVIASLWTAGLPVGRTCALGRLLQPRACLLLLLPDERCGWGSCRNAVSTCPANRDAPSKTAENRLTARLFLPLLARVATDDMSLVLSGCHRHVKVIIGCPERKQQHGEWDA